MRISDWSSDVCSSDLFSDTITVVVEAETAGRADAAARRLAERLRHAPNLIQVVTDIAGDPFFDRNGLLYLDLEDLQDLSDRLAGAQALLATLARSEEHTSELQSLMRISYAVFCLKPKTQ